MGLLRWLSRSFSGGSSSRQPPESRSRNTPGDDAIEFLFRDGVVRHTQGDIEAAEKIYRAILERNAEFVPALHLLSRIDAQRGKLREAESALRGASALSPNDAEILADLARVRRLRGNPGEARRLLERAVSLEPGRATIHYALAEMHLAGGDVESAIANLERTIALDQNHAEALNDLGAAYIETGRYEKARHSLETAARANPSSPMAFRNIASLYSRLGEPKRSAEYLRAAIEQAPRDHDLRLRLAEVLLLDGNSVAAMTEYLIVAEQRPGDALIWKRLAETAVGVDRRADAIGWYRRALDADPRQPDALNNLGILLSEDGKYEEAANVFRQAVRIQPDFVQALRNLGGAFHLQNRHDEAVDAYKKALEIDSRNLITLSNFIAITNYRRQSDADLVTGLHACYQRSLAPERIRAMVICGNDRMHGLPLRVGYLSPDFRQHSVAFFIEPVIAGHDRRRFEVHCYSDVASPDAVTERFKSLADRWHDVSSDSDEALARRIREDRIDLLVDLEGHFASNRLPVFAQKPAPVQLSYLGYPATTGLPEMDFRITDEVADPPGGEGFEYSESLVHLPEVFLCYRPPVSAPPSPKADKTCAHITFGSFNELPKISPEVIRCWSRILERITGSRLLLKATALVDPATCEQLERRFEAAGVSPDRIELIGRTATLEEHLALYARVDVALDTFPYNGTTTTCEALYMGVPVVTLSGKAHAGRVGASLLSALQLTGLVATSEDDYVAKATALGADQNQRMTYRRTLRGRLMDSPLCDARSFVKALEAIYIRCCDQRFGAYEQSRAPIKFPLNVAGALDISIGDGDRMVFPDQVDQLTAYVLLEQEDWFEDETSFLRIFLTSGMRVLDVGANFGVYTVLAARCVGGSGRVFSVEPSPTTARWLRANVALNEFENVEIFEHALSDRSGKLWLSMQAGSECDRLVDDSSPLQRGELVKVSRLDEFVRQHDIESVDFIKLDAEGAEKQIIDGGRRFFVEKSPLVMFEIKSAEEFDLALVRKFSGLGYQPMRLIPGLNLLAPVDLSQPLDSYSLNLFACTNDQSRNLVSRGLLAIDAGDESNARRASEAEVWEYLLSRNYSRAHVKAWKSSVSASGADPETPLMQVLGHYVAASSTALAPHHRLASLRAAFEIISADGFEIGGRARLNTLARIAWALGYRSRAVDALSALTQLGGDWGDTFAEPFLPASPHFDAIDPDDRLASWCEACAFDQFECLRSFSSYFLGEQNLESLERLKSNPFQRPEMERRRLLVRLRLGLPLTEASQSVQVKSPENNNPEFWLRQLKHG